MIPESFAALAAFLTLVAPGVTFELLREKRRPTIEETAFREASRIALTSLVFTVGAGAVLALVWALGGRFLVDLGDWLSRGQAYASEHLARVGLTLVLQLGLAVGMAVLTDLAFRASARGNIVPGSIWFQMFRQRCPDRAAPWVHLRLTDETEVWGYVGDYTPEQKLENRELTLTGPGLEYRRKGADEAQPLDRWAYLAVRGDEVTWLKVSYVSLDGAAGESGLVPPRKNVARRSRR
jgi:hypothetical protein